MEILMTRLGKLKFYALIMRDYDGLRIVAD